MFAGLSHSVLAVLVAGLGLGDTTLQPCKRPLYFEAGSTAVVVDLDCDGTEDELRLEISADSKGVARRWLALRGSRAEVPLEASLEIVGVADLNGDGLDDVLLLGMDPGVAVPAVVLSSDSGGTSARFSSLDIARGANLVFKESVYERCPEIIRSARFIRTAQGMGISIPHGYEEEVTCETPIPRMIFIVSGITLTLLPDP